MGAWGTAISSNDTYADIRSEFLDLYDDGVGISDISRQLIDQNQETINDEDDANNFWFALAKAQWDCGDLDPTLFSRIALIIDTGADLEVWRRLEGSERDIQKRANALTIFLEKLRSENPKPRARKRKTLKQPPFQKGSCLSFRLKNGNYGGAVVLEAKALKGFGMNLVATVRINKRTAPELDDFLFANVLLLNFATYQDEPEIGWKYSIGFQKESDLFSLIGIIDVEKDYDPTDFSLYSYGGYWSLIIEVASLQFESERTKAKPRKTLKIQKLAKHNRWRLW